MSLPKTVYVFSQDDASHKVSYNEQTREQERSFLKNRPRLGTDQSRSFTRRLAPCNHTSPESQKSSASLELTSSLQVPHLLHFDEPTDQQLSAPSCVIAVKTHRRNKALFIG